MQGFYGRVGGLEIRIHASGFLGGGDGLIRCNHPVHHLPDLVVQVGILILLQELRQVLVDRHHPRAEAAEDQLQFHARGFALEQILLERFRVLLVIDLFLGQRIAVPCGEVGNPEPRQHGVHVIDDLLRGVGLAGDIGQHFEIEVPEFV